MDMKDENNKKVDIPLSLYKKIEARLPKTDFKTVSDYITFIVREVLNNIEKDEQDGPDYTPEEEKEIEDRLRNLGYID